MSATATRHAPGLGAAHEASLRTQYCTFWAAGLYFGISVGDVQEVMRAQDMTHVPRAHPAVRGLLNLRGEIVTAIDLRHRLGLRAAGQDDDPSMNVVVRSRGEVASLLVDDIDEVVDTSDRPVEVVPSTIPDSVREVLAGVIPLPDRLLLVLDAGRAADVALASTPEGTS